MRVHSGACHHMVAVLRLGSVLPHKLAVSSGQCKKDKKEHRASNACSVDKVFCVIYTTRRTVRVVWFERDILPQDSSGTGQFQDWIGGCAVDMVNTAFIRHAAFAPHN